MKSEKFFTFHSSLFTVMLQLLQVFYNIITPILLIAALGFTLDHKFKLNTRSLSQIIIYLASPALVLTSISRTTLISQKLQQIVFFTAAVMGSMAVIGWGLASLLGLGKKLKSAFALSVTLLNAGNFGIPFIVFAFGQDALGVAVIVYATTAIVANTLGIFLASSGSASVKNSLINIVKVPLPYAVALGLLVNFGVFALPAPVGRGLELLGQAAVPLMLVVLGAQLARVKIEKQLPLIALAGSMKVLFAPVLGYFLARLMGFSGPAANIAIIQTSMPTAVISMILAEEFGSEAKFVSGVVMFSTLLSFLSLSVLLTLLGG